ncbi:hypothetical protein GCM10012284_43810 [Mangrovihabitans endophyticus]|uniref:HTH araC/xylS-type domain-containing protein n=2 Tax=Mangrovihabitans endophyticus TaxID=1751298 RepID=A0A8J3C1M3_9ACTN|nr:hypothetical protein GCM10012284_43810 [Mangrovihabitans endophyticus]
MGASEVEWARFRDYQHLLHRLPAPLEADGKPFHGFGYEFHSTELDDGVELAVNTLRRGHLLVRRTRPLIRRSDPEAYRLLVVLRGRADITQDGRGGCFRQLDLGLYDTSGPFEVWRPADTTPSTFAMLTVSRKRLAVPRGVPSGVIGEPVAGRWGIAAVLAGHLRELSRQHRHYTEADAARLAGCTVDLFGAFLAHLADERSAHTTDAWRRSLFAQVQTFAEARLDDPDLGPQTIAAAHHISVRLLHKIFQEKGLSVSAWIRDRRLERCRRDLADPQHHGATAFSIALRRGFRSESHFNRTFRNAYGLTPGQWRDQAHSAQSP